ncbi:hypothetical protein L1278_003150 [Pontibacter sp. HSC-36F09]|nr:hypothetical protein [Pontibacter sp. HSC-36F09]
MVLQHTWPVLNITQKLTGEQGVYNYIIRTVKL